MKNLVSNTAPTALLVAAGLAAVAFAQRSQAPAALPYPGALVPFVVEDDGGLANSGGPGTSNPQIIVDSDGAAGFFIINSILVEADAPQLGFEALSINQVRIDGVEFDARTGNLVGGIDGSGVVEAAELLGTPVRTIEPVRPRAGDRRQLPAPDHGAQRRRRRRAHPPLRPLRQHRPRHQQDPRDRLEAPERRDHAHVRRGRLTLQRQKAGLLA